MQLCPGSTAVLEQGEWTHCSVSCGPGQRQRSTYQIMNGQSINWKEQVFTEVSSCDTGPCPILCGVGVAVQDVVVCQNGLARTIKCADSTQRIHIINANYGRTQTNICPSLNQDNYTTCYALNSIKLVIGWCEGLSQCLLPSPSTSIFGDPCGGIYKYLQVQYQCLSIECFAFNVSTTGSCAVAVIERDVILCDSPAVQVISCNNTGSVLQRVHILSANYGRTVSQFCPGPNSNTTTNCFSPSAYNVVSGLCEGQSPCSLMGSGSLFGSDPCVGTQKYLHVQYQCLDITCFPYKATSSQLYFMESSGAGGYISSVSLYTGAQAILSPSRGANEWAVAVDRYVNMIFYTMNYSIWRANLTNVNASVKQIWTAPNYPQALALSTTDKLIFVDQFTSGLTLLNYGITMVRNLAVSKRSSFGLAVDQSARILYFTDYTNAMIWKVSYNTAGWVGSATVILSGNDTGQAGSSPTGLSLQDGALFWILYYTGEIRSMPTSGNFSVTVVPGDPSGVNTYGLVRTASVFYYTSYTSNGGVWQVTENGTRVRLTPINTLNTFGITIV